MHRSWGLVVVSSFVAVALAACSSSGSSPATAPLPSATSSATSTSAPRTSAPASPTATATSSSPTPSAAEPVFKVDRTTRMVRPKSFSLGDFGAPAMSSVTWSSWSDEGAVGTGTYEQSVCQPSCADPKTITTKATVTLERVKAGVFTRLAFKSLTSTAIPGEDYSFNGRIWG